MLFLNIIEKSLIFYIFESPGTFQNLIILKAGVLAIRAKHWSFFIFCDVLNLKKKYQVNYNSLNLHN